MADRFSKIYERPQISSYIPLPLERIEDNYRRQQGEYDKGIEDLQDTQNLIKINADPLHTEHRNKLLSNYNNQISQLADEYIKTGGSPESRYKLHNLKRQFANDPNRLQLESNYQNYNQYQKDKEERFSKGEYDPLSKEYDPYKYLQTSDEKVTPFNYTGMKGIQKHYPVIQDMMKGIKPSGTSKEWYDIDEEGNVIGKKAGWEQIARKDVDRVAAAKVPLFLQHQDSQYFKDKFLASHPNATQQDLNVAAFDNLKREGENQIFANTKSGVDFQRAPEYVNKGNRDKQDLLHGLSSIEGENVENYKVNDQIKNFINPSTGLIDVNYVNKNPLTTTIGQFESSIKGENNKEQLEKSKKEALTWGEKTASKLDISRKPNESDNNFLNRVAEEAKVNQQKVIVNKPLLDVGESMDKLLIGKNGNKFTANYDDALIPGEKNPHPINEFIKDNNIDQSSIQHSSVSFDKEHPGYILFTANTKDDEKTPIKFYAKSRNLDFKNSMEDATHFVKTFNDFYSTDKIPHSKREVNGQKFTVVGNINQNDDAREYYALDENKNPVLVVEDKKTGEIHKFDAETIKNASMKNWLDKPSTAPIIENIKDKRNFEYE